MVDGSKDVGTSIIRVKMNGVFTDVLIDTGANTSMMDLDYATQLGAMVSSLRKGEFPNLLTADHGVMRVHGKVDVTMKVGQLEIMHDYCVVKNLAARVICGMDFIIANLMTLDHIEGIANFKRGQVSIPFLSKHSYLGIAFAAQPVCINPGVEINIPLKAKRVLQTGDQITFSSLSASPGKLEVIPTKIRVGTDQLQVKVRNGSNRRVLLTGYGPVCAMVRVSEEQETTEMQTGAGDQQPQEAEEGTKKQRTYEDLKIKLGDAVNMEEAKPFQNLITNFSDCFAMSNAELTGCNLAKCSFELKDSSASPIRSKNYPLSQKDREEVERQVLQMEKDGLVERSLSPYNSPVMLVTKHDGSKRLVVDMRKVNDLLKDEVFNTLTLREMIERVGESKAKLFSLLDLRAAYNQIIIQEESRKLTAFSCSLGTFQYCRLPFGLKLSGNFFNYMVAQVISSDEVLRKNCISYVDDVLIYSVDKETHLDLLRRLFTALRAAGLKIHNEKCDFLKRKVKFVGHMFGEHGIEPEKTKIEAMTTFPRPTSKKTLKSFIGLVSFYRGYMKDLPHDMIPLLTLVGKDVKFVWKDEHEEAFQKIKSKLQDLPTLVYPDEGEGAGAFVIQTDASNKSVAGTISQISRDGQSESLIACYGRSLHKNEINWDSSQREVLAMMIAVMKFRHIIIGKPLVIRSDNLCVRYFAKLRNESAPRLIRWSIYLNDILSNAKFEHIKGKFNTVPDALSRRDYDDDEIPSERELDIIHDVFMVQSVSEMVEQDVADREDEELAKIRWLMHIEQIEGIKADDMFEQKEAEEEIPDEQGAYINVVGEQGRQKALSTPMEPCQMYCLRRNIEKETSVAPIDKELFMRSINLVITDSSHQPDSTFEKEKEFPMKDTQMKESTTAEKEETLPKQLEPDEEYEDEGSDSADETEETPPQQENEEPTTNNDKEEEGSLHECSYQLNCCVDQDLGRLQRECPECGPLIRYIENKELPEGNKECRKVMFEAETHYMDENGVLHGFTQNHNKKTIGMCDMKDWKVIPSDLRGVVLQSIHQFGHPGIARTFAILESCKYKWTGMYNDVRKFVSTCETCATGKRGLPRNKSDVKSLEIPTRVGEVLNMDIVGPLEETVDGNVYVLSVMDNFSGFVWLFPIKKQEAEIIAEKLLVVCSYTGLPDKLISDMGQNMMSKVINNFCKMLGIKQMTSMAYNHKANKIERMHRTFGDTLRTMIRGTELNKWDTSLVLIEMILRGSSTQAYPFSPAEIFKGDPIRLPVQKQIEDFERGAETDIPEYVTNLKQRLQRLHEAHKKCREMNSASSNAAYNKKTNPTVYTEGMLVYLYNDAKKPGICAKLQKEFNGPYRIKKIIGEHGAKLENVANKKVLKHPVHIDRLKKVHEGMRSNSQGSAEEEPTGGQSVAVMKLDKEEQHEKDSLPQTIQPEEQGQAKWDITNEVFEVDRLLRVKGTGANRKYLVKWKQDGSVPYKDSWIIWSDITKDAIDNFHVTHTHGGAVRAQYRRGRKGRAQ